MVPGGVTEVELWLRREGEDVLASADGGEELRVRLGLEEAQRIPLELTPRRFARGPGRAHDTARSLAAIGARLGEVLGPLLGPRITNGRLRVRICGDDFDLIALPWEAAQIGAAGPLGLVDGVEVVREVGGEVDPICAGIPGPLRLLVAVASPHGDPDTAEEVQLLLRATEGLAQVEFLDGAGSTIDALRERLDRGAVHVVHLAALGRAGALLLEHTDGRVAEVPPTELATALASSRHPPPLVVLSCRSTGAALEGPGPMHAVEPLLQAGMPRVVAFQGTVDAAYAAELARALFTELATPATAVPATALAAARVAVERGRGELAAPAHASPALFVARGLAGRSLGDGDPASDAVAAPPRAIRGFAPLPHDVILGRRRLRRELRDALTRASGRGAQLIGEAGLGKTDLAVDVLATLSREGWAVVVVHGVICLADIAAAVVAQLDLSGLSASGRRHFAALAGPQVTETTMMAELRALLAAEPLILVLADFGDNLLPDGRPPAATSQVLRGLAEAAQRGAILVLTPRRVTGAGDQLTPLLVEPLPAATITLLARAARGLDPAAREALGGHARRWRLAALLPSAALAGLAVEAVPEDSLIAALLADVGEDARRLHAALTVLRDPAPITVVAALAVAAGLAWDESRLAAAVAALAARGLLLAIQGPEPRWRPLRRLPGEPAFHLAAARVIGGGPRWGDDVAALAHLFAAGAQTELEDRASRMVRGALERGHTLAALTLSAHLASISGDAGWQAFAEKIHRRVPEPTAWLAELRAAKAQVDEPAARLVEARKAHARAQAAARARLAGEASTQAIMTADREYADHHIDEGDLERAASVLFTSLERANAALAGRSRSIGVELDAVIMVARYAAVARESGAFVTARDNLLAVRDRCELLLREDRERTDVRAALAWSLIDLCDLHFAHGDAEIAGRHGDYACMVSGYDDVDPELRFARAVALVRHSDTLQPTDLARAHKQLLRGISLLLSVDFGAPRVLASRRELAAARVRLGAIELQLGTCRAALTHLEEAAALVRDDPRRYGLGHVQLLARVHVGLAAAQALAGDSDAALATLTAADAALATVTTPREPPLGLQRARWSVANALGELQLQRGEAAEARRHLDVAAAIAGPLLAQEPDAVDLHSFTLTCLAAAAAARAVDDPAAAFAWLRDAFDTAVRMIRREPNRRDLRLLLAEVEGELAEHHRRGDDLQTARTHALASMAIADDLASIEPLRIDIQRRRAAARWTAAAIAWTTRDRDEARRLRRAGLEITTALRDRDPGRVDHEYDRVGWYVLFGHEPDEVGLEHLVAAAPIARALVDRDPGRVDFLRRLWVLRAQHGRRLHSTGEHPQRSRVILREAVQLAEDMVARRPESDAARVALLESCRELAHVDLEDVGAIPLLSRVVDLQRLRRDADPRSEPRTRALAAALVEYGKETGDTRAAATAWGEARVLLDRIHPRNPADAALIAWLDRKLDRFG